MAGIGFELKKIYRKEGIATTAENAISSINILLNPDAILPASIAASSHIPQIVGIKITLILKS